MDIAIENPAGSTRKGVDKDGKAWESTLAHHYGEIADTIGADGDAIDVFIGPAPASQRVFVVDQVDPSTGKFDEHKVVLGANSADQALDIYQANYAKDWTGGRAVTEMTLQEFRQWAYSGEAKKGAIDGRAASAASAGMAGSQERDPVAVAERDGAGVQFRQGGRSDAPPRAPADGGVDPARARRVLASIQDARLKRYGEAIKLERIEPGSSEQVDLSMRLARVFRAPIMFARVTEGPRNFGGVNSNGVVTIVDGASQAPIAITMHEVLHGLDRDIKADLVRAVMATVAPEQREKFKRVFAGYAEEKVDEEIAARLAEGQAKTPEFWERVAEKMGGSAFAKLAKQIIAGLDRMLAAFRRERLDEWTTDVAAVREALATAFAKQAQRAELDEPEAGTDFSQRERDFDDPEQRAEVSTTRPTSKKGDADPVEQKWVIDAEDIKASQKHVDAVVRALRDYNTLSGKGNAAQLMQELHEAVVENLLWLHDLVPAPVRARAKLWYDGANAIATDWTRKYGVTERQAAGVLAVLSPQMDWFKNVSLAERVLNVWKLRQNEPWSPAMTAWVESWVGASKTVDEKESRSKVLEDARRLQSTRLYELDDADAAKFVRVFDETYHERNYRLVTPEGGFGDYVTNSDDGDASVTWGGFRTIEKALSILNDGGFRNVEARLGDEHKVRNFFNNIIRPNSADGHVTIDTHAIAAALLKAASGSAKEVLDNFGAAGQSKATGASGTYGLFADAYRDAAAQRGVLPREMQSITWEAVRSLFPASIKDQLAPQIDAVWDRFRAGELTRSQARKEVKKIAGGIRPMAWEGGDTGRGVEDGGTSFETAIPDDPTQRQARLLPAAETKDKIAVSLSAATPSIPGLARLHELAGKGDGYAHQLLQDIALDSLQHLLAGTSARVKADRATGLYGGEIEPSLGLSITFTDTDRKAVLAALAKFGENFNQEQIHVRGGTKFKAGSQYDDGSYATPVYRWNLKKALDRRAIQRVIDKSGLYGLTFGEDFVEAYYVGDPANEEARAEFDAAIDRADRELAKAAGAVGRSVARLWAYGRGDGAIGYDRIRGDVAAGPAAESDTARRVAEYLTRTGDQPGRVRAFPQASEVTPAQRELQERIASIYESLPDNDLRNPRVRRAYQELAKEVIRQYRALPIKVEVLTGQGEPYRNSEAMRRDVLDNNHLFIFGTTPETFGPDGVDFTGHPLLEDSGLKDSNGHRLLYNDLLRAVHDYFAHTMSPVQFGPKGEEAAWKNHMAMTPNAWARWALTSETRGQNSWVNFRPGVDAMPVKDRPFARQKVALLPLEYALTGDRAVDAPMKEFIAATPAKQRSGSAPADTLFSDERRSPEVRELLAELKRLPFADKVAVFGSVARGTDGEFSDLDVVVDLRPAIFRGVNQLREYDALIRMAKRRYGSFDPFLRFGNALFVRNDLATGWQAAINQRSMLAAMDRDGRPLSDVSFSDERRADVSPLGFYSALARAVEGGPGQAMPDQWRAFLKGLTSKGVKADEIEWSGINEWLQTQADKVKREAVVEFLRGNGVRVEEMVLGAAGALPADWVVEDDGAGGYVVIDEDGDTRGAGETAEAAEADAMQNLGSSEPGTKYGQYTLPGGENYRELLLTLSDSSGPGGQGGVSLEEARAHVRRRFEAGALDPEQRDAALRDPFAYYKPSEIKPGATFYRSSHWDQANILAHVRFNERTDADGKRVLFIEEIQSDWAQEGKKKGFAGAAAPALSDAQQRAIRGRYDRLMTELPRLFEPTDSIDVMLVRMGNRETQDALREAGLPALEERANPLVRQEEVPRAPFVGKTDAWVALALKRMVRYAVDNGFDRVAFVTGEQSAERYDLSKQVDSIEVTWVPTVGEYTVNAYKGRERVIERQAADEAEIADIIGKDPARKAVDGIDKSATTRKGRTSVLSGLDLKVGGEGMKAFYNKIVPAVAKDVLKKLGGEFRTVDLRNAMTIATGYQPAKGWAGPSKQPGFDVTPAMRERASAGMPLFSDIDQRVQSQREAFGRKFIGTDVQRRGTSLADLGTGNVKSDRMVDLLTYAVDAEYPIVNAVRKAASRVADQWKMAVEALPGRVADAMKREREGAVEPLTEAIGQAAKKLGIRSAQLVDAYGVYRLALHAPERNATLRAQGSKKANPAGMSEAEAAQWMAFFNGEPELLSALKSFDPLLKRLQERTDSIKLKAGLLTQEEIDARAGWQHYVSLQGDPALADVGGRTPGRGWNDDTDKSAKGRDSLSANPIVNTVKALEVAVRNAELARVKEATFNFARAHPDVIGAKIKRLVRRPVYDENGNFTAVVPNADKFARDAVVYRQGNVEYHIEIGDSRVAESLKGLNGYDVDPIVRGIGALTRTLGRLYTQFSPHFPVVNFLRDAQQQLSIIIGSQLTGANNKPLSSFDVAWRVVSRYPATFKAAIEEVWGRKNGGKYRKLARELVANGGMTGLTRMLNDEDALTDFVSEVKQKAGQAKGLVAWNKFVGAVQGISEVFELTSRVAVYSTLRDLGAPIDAAANATKNLMNFNKAGTGTRGWAGNLYMFLRPSIQDVYKTSQLLRTRKGALVFASMYAGALAVYAMLREMSGDDEDDDRLKKMDTRTAAERRAYYVLPVGGEEPVRVPVGFGLPRLAWGLAVTTIDSALNPDFDAADAVDGVIKSAGSSLSPMQISDINALKEPFQFAVTTLMPTLGVAPVELAMNKTKGGFAIRSDSPFDMRPNYARGWAATPKEWKDAAQWMHDATDGKLDVAPETLQYLVRTYGGGPAGLVINAMRSREKLRQGEPLTGRDVPVMQAFIGPEDRYVEKSLRELAEEARKIKGSIDDAFLRNPERGERLTRDERKMLVYGFKDAIDDLAREEAKAMKALRALQASGQYEEGAREMKVIEQQFRAAKQELMNAYNAERARLEGTR